MSGRRQVGLFVVVVAASAAAANFILPGGLKGNLENVDDFDPRARLSSLVSSLDDSENSYAQEAGDETSPSSSVKLKREEIVPPAQASSSSKDTNVELYKALEAKRALESQQDKLIEEIIQYRRRIKKLEEKSQPVQAQQSDDNLKLVEQLKIRVSELEREKTALNQQLAAKAINTQPPKDSTILPTDSGEVRRLRDLNKELKSYLNTQKAELESSEKRAKELEASLEQTKGELSKRIGELKNVEQRIGSVEAFEKKKSTLEAELKTAREKVSSLEAKLLSTEKALKSINRDEVEASHWRDLKKELSAYISMQKTQLEAAEEKNADLNAKLDRALKELGDRAKEVDGLRSDLAKQQNFESETILLQGKVKDHENVIRALKAKIDEAAEQIAVLETDRNSLKREIGDKQSIEAALGEERSRREQGAQEIHHLTLQLQSAKAETALKTREMEVLKADLERSSEYISKYKTLEQEAASLKSQLAQRTAEVQKYASCETELRNKAQVEEQAAELKKQLAEVKIELLKRETKLQLLDSSAEEVGTEVQSPSSASGTRVSVPPTRVVREVPAPNPTPSAASASAPNNDVLVVVVKADKVNLRTGPGAENSPLMQVSRGTRLTVETREGDWYRVFTPTGSRAWILADVVQTEMGRGSSAPSTAHQAVSQRGPVKQPVRVIKDQDMVPFGNDGAGYGGGAKSMDSLAFERIKSSLGRNK